METRNDTKYDDAVLKHLEFIQNIVTRLARNSFLLKQWAVTLVAAIFALTINNPSIYFVAVAILPTLAFWILDAYYLRQERLFRKLYEKVSADPDKVDQFSMNISPYTNVVQSWGRIAFSVSVLPFYGALTAVVILAIVGLQFIT